MYLFSFEISLKAILLEAAAVHAGAENDHEVRLFVKECGEDILGIIESFIQSDLNVEELLLREVKALSLAGYFDSEKLESLVQDILDLPFYNHPYHLVDLLINHEFEARHRRGSMGLTGRKNFGSLAGRRRVPFGDRPGHSSPQRVLRSGFEEQFRKPQQVCGKPEENRPVSTDQNTEDQALSYILPCMRKGESPKNPEDKSE